jgi:hypothetical protein
LVQFILKKGDKRALYSVQYASCIADSVKENWDSGLRDAAYF